MLDGLYITPAIIVVVAIVIAAVVDGLLRRCWNRGSYQRRRGSFDDLWDAIFPPGTTPEEVDAFFENYDKQEREETEARQRDQGNHPG